MAIVPYKQLSIADIFSNCQDIYESDIPEFLSLLQSYIDLGDIVPASFLKHFCINETNPQIPLNSLLMGSHYSADFFYSY